MPISLGSPIADHFATLTDPRRDQTKRHHLLDILTIALCAMICGADEWVAMEEFGNAKREWFDTFLDLPNGIPSHDTFGRVFAALNPDEFHACFLGWVQQTVIQTDGVVVACDGKTVRRSHDRGAGKAAVHMVSAWAAANHLVLGQVAVAERSNEITALPALLKVLMLKGCIVTIDAMGCQREIAAQIVEQQADYVLALKENHATVYHEVVHLFADGEETGYADYDADAAETLDSGHGRVEIRRYRTIRDPATLAHVDPEGAWTGLGALGMVESERRERGTVSRERRYYLTSLRDAAEFGRAAREHWGIENGLHWVLDIAFREDESRARVGASAANLAVLRHIALNLLKQERTAKVGVKNKRLKAGWDERYLLKVIAG
ncbi:MAG: ISAs1 family transposase [Thermomicrobia bacterium]|nr:ISAs1 family transposase [Thermomicrobia bacterium]